MKKSVLIIVVFLGVFSAHAKSDNDANAGYGGDVQATVEAHSATLATVQNQVNEVVDKFQIMNGDIAREAKKNKDQDKVSHDLEIRVQVMEDKMDLVLGQLQELRSVGLMKPPSSQRLKEYMDYARGLEYMNAKQYDKAITEFTAFNEKNKGSFYESFAQYWVGEAYYMQSDYPMAIKQYQKVLTKDPKSAKAPTALYRQGMSFYFLQSLNDAKAFFSKVIRSYPGSIEAIQSSSQLARINNIEMLRKQQELEMNTIN